MSKYPVYTYGDYDIYAIDRPTGKEQQRYLVTEGGVVLWDDSETFDEAFEGLLDILDMEVCETCGEMLPRHDPLCPFCYPNTFAQVNKLQQVWLDQHPQAGDVLDISFEKDGRMIVKTYNLYSKDKWG